MKLIIAILRDERVEETKEALGIIGVSGVTFLYVTGRGQQKGRVSTREMIESLRTIRMPLAGARPVENSLNDRAGIAGFGDPDTGYVFGFLPKRMLILVAEDNQVNRIIQAIVNVNQTGRHGDGRIFICPMIGAIRIRTGEQNDKALS